jgi:hypothetical protein
MTMNAKRSFALTIALTILVSALALSTGACVSPGVRVGLGIRVFAPPPPLREEVVVRPGPQLVWVPGHWDWVAGTRDYVWIPGAWVRPPRPHAVWVAPRYELRGRGHFFIAGYWKF